MFSLDTSGQPWYPRETREALAISGRGAGVASEELKVYLPRHKIGNFRKLKEVN
jgi:hypothetical protein